MKFKFLEKASTMLSNKMGRTGIVLKKHSPEIALWTGIVGVIGTVGLACYETTKAEQVIQNHRDRLNRIQEAADIYASGEETDIIYDNKAIGRDKFICCCKTASECAKLYAPAVITGAISIGLILWSHGVMKSRYLGAVAAYNAVNEAFKMYRKRVIDEGGDNLDRHYMFGTELETVEHEVVDENGKKRKVKETVEKVPDNSTMNEYARLWAQGETNAYMDNPNNSLMFLRGQEKYLNNLLQTRGHVFLNEVLDSLGYEMTPVGAVTGWVKGNKDDYIDFGIWRDDDPTVRAFVTGRSKTVPLEFNVDGVILNMI